MLFAKRIRTENLETETRQNLAERISPKSSHIREIKYANSGKVQEKQTIRQRGTRHRTERLIWFV